MLTAPATSRSRATRVARDGGRVDLRRHWIAYAFFAPALLLVAAVSLMPMAYAVRQSLYRSNYLDLGRFVGLANYVWLFTRGHAWGNLRASLVFVAGSVAVATVLGFGLAVILNRDVRFRGFFRSVLIIPWVVSQLITALLWKWILNNQLGPVAATLALVGVGMPNITTDVTLAMPSLIVANGWRGFPLVMVFVLAALQTIPVEVIEAAGLDGASRWQTFWRIKLPLIRNTTLVALVLTTLNAFNMVTLVLVMTGGGPADATYVSALRVFEEGFVSYRMGLATANAIIICALNILFTLVYVRVLRTAPGQATR
jgi:ABC-type sugar transport system permease subunit